MPMNDPHAYMTRNVGDMQMRNPKNPKVKLPSGNMPMRLGALAKARKSHKRKAGSY